ncbi:MAG: quinolinate synthase [Firmicutes bacterium]|nr:quinolinate synthase [Bacillota bacterium]
MLPQTEVSQLKEEIMRLKKERNAVIMAHYYQSPDVHEVADFVGDSLELARKAATTNADVIVLCGVHFMAESAAILCPDKTVLLAEAQAGCPMADMVTGEMVRERKKQKPDMVVVSYVNTTAEVKAESDICCTSANAVKIVQSIPEGKEILFLPDRNLGSYVMKKTGRDMMVWDGFCCVHNRIKPEEITKAKQAHPSAIVLIHPECRPEVVSMADCVASTAGIIAFARQSEAKEFIVVTEVGILYQLRKACPDKEFYLPSETLLCANMKKITAEKVKNVLETMEPKIVIQTDIYEKALQSLKKMLAVG